MDMNELNQLALDALPAAVTITDPHGAILYFNPAAQKKLNRNPEYIGQNVRDCHKKQSSIDRIEAMLARFRSGDLENQTFEVDKPDRTLHVTMSALVRDGNLAAVMQTIVVMPKPETSGV